MICGNTNNTVKLDGISQETTSIHQQRLSLCFTMQYFVYCACPFSQSGKEPHIE